MPDLLLVHWNAEEAAERGRELAALGHRVRVLSSSDAKALRPVVEEPPELTLIDLGRLPSHGREVGSYFRRRKPTRRVPLVFVGGALWILWPKKASGVASDLDGNAVRRYGLERELVDYKIAAVDATWSGLRFARRAKGDPAIR